MSLSHSDRSLIYALLSGQEELLGIVQNMDKTVTTLAMTVATQGANIMAQFDDVEQALADETNAGNMLAAALDTIHGELQMILDTGATPARIQALQDKIAANKQAWVDAANRNPDPNAPPAPPSGP